MKQHTIIRPGKFAPILGVPAGRGHPRVTSLDASRQFTFTRPLHTAGCIYNPSRCTRPRPTDVRQEQATRPILPRIYDANTSNHTQGRASSTARLRRFLDASDAAAPRHRPTMLPWACAYHGTDKSVPYDNIYITRINHSVINTAAEDNNATGNNEKLPYEKINATAIPTTADQTDDVESKIAGNVIAARTATGIYSRNDWIKRLLTGLRNNANGKARGM